MQNITVKRETLDFRAKEAYRTLRTNIDFSGDNIHVVCITSCMPSEGKSSISFELACTFAQDGKKTLLIDADLRKSVLKSRHKSGKVRYGLTHYLAGQIDLTEALCSTDIANMNLIYAGPVPPNPSELLGNAQFQKLIEKVRNVFDMVVIDTPPLGSVIDAAIVSRQCDGAIIVLESGKISYHFARKVKEQLEMADCRILGCVLNKVDMSGKGYYGRYGKYGSKYYGNYYGEQEAE